MSVRQRKRSVQPMTRKERNRIIHCYEYVVDTIRAEDIVDGFFQNRFLTQDDLERIQLPHQTTRDKNRKLMKCILESTRPGLYTYFYEALRRDYPWLCDMLDKVPESALRSNSTVIPGEEEEGIAYQQVQQCQRLLAEHYEEKLSRLWPIPWDDSYSVHINDAFTDLSMQSTHALLPECYSKCTLEEITKSTLQCQNPRRILIQGQVGVGKSTLCRKLAYDWARACHCNKNKIELVFLLEIGNMLNGISFQENVYRQLLPLDSSIDWENVWKYITENQSKCLFILDSMDDIGDKTVDHLPEFLNGKLLPHSRAIITCRPQLTTYNRSMNKILKIVGFTKEMVEHYVLNKSPLKDEAEKKQQLLEEMEKSGALYELCETPLLLNIMCLLQREKCHLLLDSKVSFYEQLSLFIVHRALGRRLGHVTRTDTEEARHLMAKLAWKGLEEGKILFEEDELIRKGFEKIVRLGLLVSKKSSSIINPYKLFTFPHKSLQTYLAAWYLCQQDNIDDIAKLVGTKVDQFHASKMYLGEDKVDDATPLIFRFLVGIMDRMGKFRMLHEFLTILKEKCRNEQQILKSRLHKSVTCIRNIAATGSTFATGNGTWDALLDCLTEISNGNIRSEMVQLVCDAQPEKFVCNMCQVDLFKLKVLTECLAASKEGSCETCGPMNLCLYVGKIKHYCPSVNVIIEDNTKRWTRFFHTDGLEKMRILVESLKKNSSIQSLTFLFDLSVMLIHEELSRDIFQLIAGLLKEKGKVQQYRTLALDFSCDFHVPSPRSPAFPPGLGIMISALVEHTALHLLILQSNDINTVDSSPDTVVNALHKLLMCNTSINKLVLKAKFSLDCWQQIEDSLKSRGIDTANLNDFNTFKLGSSPLLESGSQEYPKLSSPSSSNDWCVESRLTVCFANTNGN